MEKGVQGAEPLGPAEGPPVGTRTGVQGVSAPGPRRAAGGQPAGKRPRRARREAEAEPQSSSEAERGGGAGKGVQGDAPLVRLKAASLEGPAERLCGAELRAQRVSGEATRGSGGAPALGEQGGLGEGPPSRPLRPAKASPARGSPRRELRQQRSCEIA